MLEIFGTAVEPQSGRLGLGPREAPALIRPDYHEAFLDLILIDIDHEILIMKEGVWWPTTDTCKR